MPPRRTARKKQVEATTLEQLRGVIHGWVPDFVKSGWLLTVVSAVAVGIFSAGIGAYLKPTPPCICEEGSVPVVHAPDSVFMSPDDLRNSWMRLLETSDEVQEHIGTIIREELAEVLASGGLGRSHSDLQRIVSQEISRYTADRTGRIDYAMYSLGGRVIESTPAVTWASGFPGVVRNFAARIGSIHPDYILQPTIAPGHCYPVPSNSPAFFRIKLINQVVPTAITIEHAPLALLKESESIPKGFRVLYQERVLGEFEYDPDIGSELSTFQLNPIEEPINEVTVEVLSNHGDPKVTCIYRVRIHAD